MDAVVLGALAVRDSRGVSCTIPSGRSGALLAALLVHAGGVVPVEALIGYVWDEEPPRNARAALQTMLTRLRQAIGAEAAARIKTVPPGYLLDLQPGELDMHRFGEMCGRGYAAHAAGDWEAAERWFGEAVDLWQGEPLAGVDSRLLQLEVAGPLAERRLDAITCRNEAGLNLGWHNRLLPELVHLAEFHPWREAFRGQLMLALHRAGRTADALAAYQQGRKLLADELGIEPGGDLQALHRQILADEVPARLCQGTGQRVP